MATDAEIEKVAIRMRDSLKDVVEAAKEMTNFAIEDVRATEVEPLRTALREIIKIEPPWCDSLYGRIARAALGEKD